MKDLFNKNTGFNIVSNVELPKEVNEQSVLDMLYFKDKVVDIATATVVAYDSNGYGINTFMIVVCKSDGKSIVKICSGHYDYFTMSDLSKGVDSLHYDFSNTLTSIDIYSEILCGMETDCSVGVQYEAVELFRNFILS